MFHFEVVADWIDTLLMSNMPQWLALAIEFVLIGILILSLYAVLALILILAERKICAYFQCRLGPNRVGPWGILQPIADMVKILLKEIIPLNRADNRLFRLASFMVIIASLLTFGAIPFDKGLHAIDFNIGVFYLLAVSSIGVVGIMLAGWSSNSKYTMIGAMRSGAQLISYELAVVADSGTTSRCLVHLQRRCPCFHRLCDISDSRTRRDQPRSVRLARGRVGADGRLPYRVFGYHFRLFLSGRVYEYVYNRCRSRNDVPRRLATAAYTGARRFQYRDGLYTACGVVFR